MPRLRASVSAPVKCGQDLVTEIQTIIPGVHGRMPYQRMHCCFYIEYLCDFVKLNRLQTFQNNLNSSSLCVNLGLELFGCSTRFVVTLAPDGSFLYSEQFLQISFLKVWCSKSCIERWCSLVILSIIMPSLGLLHDLVEWILLLSLIIVQMGLTWLL